MNGVQISNDASHVAPNAHVFTTSGGTIYVFIMDDGGSDDYAIIGWKSTNNGVSWSSVPSLNNKTVTGLSENNGMRFDIALGANGYAHCMPNINYQPEDEGEVYYGKFNTANDTWGSFTLAFIPSREISTHSMCVDSSDKVHYIYRVPYGEERYTNNVSGSWISPEYITDIGSGTQQVLALSSTHIHTFCGGGSAHFWNPQEWERVNGNWSAVHVWTNCLDYNHNNNMVVDDSGDVICGGGRADYPTGGGFDCYIDDVAQGRGKDFCASILTYSDGTLYQITGISETTNKFFYRFKHGSDSWGNEIVLEDVPVEFIRAEYSYSYYYRTAGTPLIYSKVSRDGLWFIIMPDWNEYRSSKHAYLRGKTDTSSSKHAYIQSGLCWDSVSCYMEAIGEDLVPDSDIANVSNWVNEEGGSELYPSLADNSDSTYVHKVIQEGDYFEVGLSDPTQVPYRAGQHQIVWRFEQHQGTNIVTVKIDLKQESTIIATDQLVIDDILAEHILSLTPTQINSITDYTKLRYRVTIVSIEQG